MWTRHSESEMSRVVATGPCSSSLTFLLILIVGISSRIIGVTSAQPVDSSLHNLRLLSSTQQSQHVASSLIPPVMTSGRGELKSRKVREISRGVEDDISSSPVADYSQLRPVSSASKVKGLYPPLTGSGELLRLFRPLALSPDKTIGMGRWYLPGFGYFSRGGRATSSNFIRFGRSGKLLDEDDGTNGGGDVTMLSRNNPKKKNNFIRLGRENPRQTNFIRLGRSGPPGEFYNSGYITPALSDPFREDDEGRQELN